MFNQVVDRIPERFLLLIRTVRYLTVRQIIFQVWYRLNSAKAKIHAPPSIRNLEGTQYKPFTRFVYKPDSLLRIENESPIFRFLNDERFYAHSVHWKDMSASRLWRYTLHYFDYLNTETAFDNPEFVGALAKDWIHKNPPTQGSAWEPYPVSLRIVNWIKWLSSVEQIPEQDRAQYNQSLATQTRWLMRKLEWHIMANHLFANAKALVFAGMYFQGAEAERWLSKGMSLVSDQLTEQVLADGAHYERSPMYHNIILEDVLDLINCARGVNLNENTHKTWDVHVKHWSTFIDKMLDWTMTMQHPDGGLAFFNDSALGIATDTRSLCEYATKLGLTNQPYQQDCQSSAYFSQSGYARLQAGKAVLLANATPVGPSYQPGHTHADTLSFEFSYEGCRVFVNSGSFTSAVAQFYLHPEVTLLDNQRLLVDNRWLLRLQVSNGTIREESTEWYPEFGLKKQNKCLTIDFDGPELTFELLFEGER